MVTTIQALRFNPDYYYSTPSLSFILCCSAYYSFTTLCAYVTKAATTTTTTTVATIVTSAANHLSRSLTAIGQQPQQHQLSHVSHRWLQHYNRLLLAA